MKTLLMTFGLLLSLFSMQGQTTCAEDNVAYVHSKNVGATGAYTLSIGGEEMAAQTYHYVGQGKVEGAKVYGTVPTILGVPLKVSVYNVDITGRPMGAALASASLSYVYSWSPAFFEVSFSPAVAINNNFAIVVEVIHLPSFGHDFLLQYTGNGEGLGADLASLTGTSTGFNWASAMTTFNKDGDFYLYPRMMHYNIPLFSVASSCVNAGASIDFTNETQMTTAAMFNKIGTIGYAGSNSFYTWNFGDGSGVSHLENPTHIYGTAGSYIISLTSTIEGWDGICTQTYLDTISVGLAINTSTITNVSCNGGNNGSTVVLGSGGAMPYTYRISGLSAYQSGTTFSGLGAGIYTLYIKDNVGCIRLNSLTITDPAPIIFTGNTSTNSSCGNTDGGILITTSGGVAPVKYQLNSGTYQTSGTFANLAAGAYTINAKDVNNCIKSTMVIVNDAGGPTFSVTNSTNVSCFGGNDGTISLSSLGGTGAIKYSINGGTNFQSSGNFPNIIAGTYMEVVKDAANCTDIRIVTINEPQVLTLTASSTPLSCFESQNGQINITSTSGGTGLMSYSLDGTTFQSGISFPNLAAGAYTVYAKDGAGCLKNVAVTITQPTALTATIVKTNTICYGAQDGTISIVATGGTPGYVYGMNNDTQYQNNNTFNHLAAGTYNLVVTDKNDCVYTTTVNITEPMPVVPFAAITNSTCGNSNGSILAIANGGSGFGYTYRLNGGAFGAGSFSPLAAGVYVITAKDNAGCLGVVNATVADSDGPSILASSHTNVLCHGGNDGSITIGQVSGGTGTLNYSINGVAYQASSVFTGLSAGSYNVTVKDGNACVGSISITLTEPNAFVITKNIVNELCNGGATGTITLSVGGGSGTLAYSINGGITYQASNSFTGLAAGTYLLTVRDAGGCLGYVFATINQPTAISVSYNSLNVTCHGANNGQLIINATGGSTVLKYSLNGSAYQFGNVFTGLAGGSYNVSVKDANNCVKTIGANVFEPLPLSASANVSNVTCAGGSNGAIDLYVNGGSFIYYFSWSNGAISQDIFNLSAGIYDVIVRDGNNCATGMTFTITEPAIPVIVNGTVTNSNGANGAINITVTGGVGGYTFLWSNNATSTNLANLAPGIYSVVVTDMNGCSSSSTFVVESTVGISSAEINNNLVSLYPNPTNDYIMLESTALNMDKVEISNALGQILYNSEPHSSSIKINTRELSVGVYFVKIQMADKLVTKRLQIIR